MKKLTILFTILSFAGFGQAPSRLGLGQIQYAPGAGYVPYTDATGKQTYSLLTTVSPTTGLLPNTTSITINGVTKTFTSTPSFTVGDLLSTSSYTNPSWLSSLAWSKITGTPTTISGYGITNPLIQGTLTANSIPKAISSFSVGDSHITDDNSTINLGLKTTIAGGNNERVLDVFGTHGGSSRFVIRNDALSAIQLYNISESEPTCEFWGYHGVGAVWKAKTKFSFRNQANVDFLNISNIETTPVLNFTGFTANSLHYADANKDLRPLTIGSGLSLTSGTLSATGTGSTTTVNAGSNISVTGSAPNYTVAVSSALTNSVTDNSTAIGTLSTNVTANTNSITAWPSATQTLTNKSLTSPTLTGVPIAPTAAGGTNNTQIATTAFVTNEVIFTLTTSFATFASPADATTYYWDAANTALTSSANAGIYLPKNCTLIEASITHISTATASSENCTLGLRLNDATNTSFTTTQPVTGTRLVSRITGISVNYSAGDLILPYIITPTWTTNATNWRIAVIYTFKLR